MRRRLWNRLNFSPSSQSKTEVGVFVLMNPHGVGCKPILINVKYVRLSRTIQTTKRRVYRGRHGGCCCLSWITLYRAHKALRSHLSRRSSGRPRSKNPERQAERWENPRRVESSGSHPCPPLGPNTTTCRSPRPSRTVHSPPATSSRLVITDMPNPQPRLSQKPEKKGDAAFRSAVIWAAVINSTEPLASLATWIYRFRSISARASRRKRLRSLWCYDLFHITVSGCR